MKKKILYVHHSGGMGGAPRSLAFLINELDKTKYEPVIWMMRDGEARVLFEETGAQVIYNTNKFIQPYNGTTVSGMNCNLFFKNILGYIPTYILAKRIIKKISPDIIHLSTTCLFHFAKAATKIDKKIKVICHIREPLLPNFHGKVLLNNNVNYVDKFIAISENDGAPFIEKGAKVKVVYNFVNISDFKFDDKIRKEYRAKLNYSYKTLIVSFFARVSEGNGVLNLLEIAKKLKDNNEIKFLIFGYKGETDYERQVFELKPSNVNLMPMTNNVKEYLMSSDVIISPFIIPHFSRSIVEASSMGKPSIVSNVKSQNELIIDKKTGFFYNSLDEAVDLINELYSNRDLLESMGLNARAFAENNFSASKNAKKTFEEYAFD